MENNRQFVAHYVTSEQITQDEYTRINKTLIVTEETTIGEIREWYTKGFGNPLLAVMDIHITENSPLQKL